MVTMCDLVYVVKCTVILSSAIIEGTRVYKQEHRDLVLTIFNKGAFFDITVHKP